MENITPIITPPKSTTVQCSIPIPYIRDVIEIGAGSTACLFKRVAGGRTEAVASQQRHQCTQRISVIRVAERRDKLFPTVGLVVVQP